MAPRCRSPSGSRSSAKGWTASASAPRTSPATSRFRWASRSPSRAAEFKGMMDRAEYMISIAEETLAPDILPPKAGFRRRIEHVPLGVVFNVAAWNYPLLIPINVVVPALLAGNTVLLKHSAKTPLVRQALCRGVRRAGNSQSGRQSGDRPRADRPRDRRSARRARGLHRLGRGRPANPSPRGRTLHRRRTRTRRQRSGLRRRRRRSGLLRRRTWSTAPATTRASRAAPSNGSTSIARSTTPFWRSRSP